jgi:hypothetical protein
MIRVAGCMEDFPCNSDLAEKLAALLKRDNDVAVTCNVHIVVPWLCPRLHDRDGINLDIEYEEGNAFLTAATLTMIRYGPNMPVIWAISVITKPIAS